MGDRGRSDPPSTDASGCLNPVGARPGRGAVGVYVKVPPRPAVVLAGGGVRVSRGPMRNVFLSYSRRNASEAQSLAGDLEALGHRVWLDQELGGGQRWWDQITSQVRECDVFVCAIAPESLESEACRRELAYAEALRKPILPVLITDGVSTNRLPTTLAQLQLVDHREADREAALRLGRAFTVLPAPQPLPTPVPDPPEAPMSYLGALQDKLDSSEALGFETQSALLLQLKHALGDPEVDDDARELLARLRARRELLAVIAEEIDALAGTTAGVATPEAPSPPAPEATRETPRPAVEEAPSEAEPRRPKPARASGVGASEEPVRRVPGALWGAAVATVLAAVATVLGMITPTLGLTGLVESSEMLVGGAVAGWIAGMRRRETKAALIVGVGLWVFGQLVVRTLAVQFGSETMYALGYGSTWLAPLSAIGAAAYYPWRRK